MKSLLIVLCLAGSATAGVTVSGPVPANAYVDKSQFKGLDETEFYYAAMEANAKALGVVNARRIDAKAKGLYEPRSAHVTEQTLDSNYRGGRGRRSLARSRGFGNGYGRTSNTVLEYDRVFPSTFNPGPLLIINPYCWEYYTQ